MPVRALVVDDSGFFRRRITEILNADPDIEVVGTAADGREALLKVVQLKPDVITMDVEMPVMDGITAVRRITAMQPTPVLMFSSLTSEGAQATLDALDAGATDFLPKRFEDIATDRARAASLLCQRVRILGRRRSASASPPPPAPKPVAPERVAIRHGDFQLVAIGASTGGPVALQRVLTALPAQFPLPLLLLQHMPASFTPAFATRLDQLCAIRVKEAADGDLLEPGLALLAPGGRQMVPERVRGQLRVRITDSAPDQYYRPSVDVTFTAVAKVCNGRVLAIVLTGMGADGREGARLLKQGGSVVWAQDEETSVVYGMPGAVAPLADRILPLDSIGPGLAGSV